MIEVHDDTNAFLKTEISHHLLQYFIDMILVGISVGMPTKQSGVKIYHSGKLAPGQR